MFSKFLNLLLVFECSVTFVFAQTSNAYVLSCLGSQSRVGNISLSSTLGQPFAAKLTSASNVVTVGFEQPQMQINTDSTPVAAICSRQIINIPYRAWGYIDTNNIFTAQLSDGVGSFANATSIGTKTGTASGFITSTIPGSLPSGSDYRIRVISSAPDLHGKPDPKANSTGACDSNQTEILTTEQSNLSEFRCFPVPAGDMAFFSIPNNKKGEIIIYDLNGNAVIDFTCAGEKNQSVDVSKLTQGVYVATYHNADTFVSLKIVKQ